MNLDEAINAAATQEAPAEAAVTPEPAAVIEAPATREPAPESKDAAPADGPSRTPDGKFAPKTKAVAAAEPSHGAPPPPAAAAQPAPAAKAPSSWTPEEREEWAKLTPAAQKAVLRREENADQLAKDMANARQVLERFEKSVGPYRNVLNPQDPFATITDLLHSSQQLQFGAGPQKQGLLLEMAKRFGVPVDANFAASLINNHALDLNAINAALGDGATPPAAGGGYQSPDSIRAMVQQEAKAQAEAYVHQMMQSQRQQQNQTAIDAFGASHEYFSDLAPTMAQLITGGVCSKDPAKLEEAYTYALNLPKHADIKRLVDQRAKAAEVAAGPGQRVAGPRPEPASGPRAKTGKAMTLDEAIAAASEQAAG